MFARTGKKHTKAHVRYRALYSCYPHSPLTQAPPRTRAPTHRLNLTPHPLQSRISFRSTFLLLAREEITFYLSQCMLKIEHQTHNHAVTCFIMQVNVCSKLFQGASLCSTGTSAIPNTFRWDGQCAVKVPADSYSTCFSGVPTTGGGPHQHAQVCSLGPLQSFLHAVRQRWWGELNFFLFIWFHMDTNTASPRSLS